MKEKSPDGQKKALNYESRNVEFFNVLGSDTRFYLGFKKYDILGDRPLVNERFKQMFTLTFFRFKYRIYIWIIVKQRDD